MSCPGSSCDPSQPRDPATSSNPVPTSSTPENQKSQTSIPQTSKPTMPSPQPYNILSMPTPGSIYDNPETPEPAQSSATKPTSSVPTTYPLSRSPLSTARLIAQHALWQHDLRFLLHPAIAEALAPLHPKIASSSQPPSSATRSAPSPPSEQKEVVRPLRIHDLATGTAFWALSLLQLLSPEASDPNPNDVTITASDISLAQAPHGTTLPRGMELCEWDIYDDAGVPPHWKGAYDVVHLRLALLVIRGGDATPVLKKAWEMLRPGGWMQWDELDVEGARVMGDGGGAEPENLTKFQRMQENASFEGLRWVRKLEDTLREVGFEEVGKEMFEGERSIAGFLQSLQFLVMQEEMESKAKGGKGGGGEGEELAKDLEFGLMMSQKGVARVVPKVVFWGQKPLVERR